MSLHWWSWDLFLFYFWSDTTDYITELVLSVSFLAGRMSQYKISILSCLCKNSVCCLHSYMGNNEKLGCCFYVNWIISSSVVLRKYVLYQLLEEDNFYFYNKAALCAKNRYVCVQNYQCTYLLVLCSYLFWWYLEASCVKHCIPKKLP